MATTSMTSGVLAPPRIAAGVVGGLVGGVAFGVLMHSVGMIEMVAMLNGSEAIAVGWLVHLANSAFIGALCAVLLGNYAKNLVPAIGVGIGYGLAWWVVGGLLLMPARLGMEVFVLNTAAWQSLMGHVYYGVLRGGFGDAGCPRAQGVRARHAKGPSPP